MIQTTTVKRRQCTTNCPSCCCSCKQQRLKYRSHICILARPVNGRDGCASTVKIKKQKTSKQTKNKERNTEQERQRDNASRKMIQAVRQVTAKTHARRIPPRRATTTHKRKQASLLCLFALSVCTVCVLCLLSVVFVFVFAVCCCELWVGQSSFGQSSSVRACWRARTHTAEEKVDQTVRRK